MNNEETWATTSRTQDSSENGDASSENADVVETEAWMLVRVRIFTESTHVRESPGRPKAPAE